MKAGRLNRKITIQRRVSEQDAVYGTEIGSWEDYMADVPAEVQDVLPSKAESVVEGMELSANPSRVRTRYIPGITSAMRVVVHGETERTCEIISGPAELGVREGLEFMIVEYSV